MARHALACLEDFGDVVRLQQCGHALTPRPSLLQRRGLGRQRDVQVARDFVVGQDGREFRHKGLAMLHNGWTAGVEGAARGRVSSEGATPGMPLNTPFVARVGRLEISIWV